MSKVRIVVIDLEGDDATVQAALRGVLEAQQTGGIAAPVEVLAPSVTTWAVGTPALDGVVANTLPKPSQLKAAAPPVTIRRAVSGEPGTLSDAIRLAVQDGPKTNGDVMRFVAAKGFDSESSTVSTILCQLRKKGEIYKADEDLTWRVAVAPPK